MCGRFTLLASRQEIAGRFEVDEVVTEDPLPRYNVAPSQQVLAVATSADGGRRLLGAFRWGLVPTWAKDPSVGNRMVNARAETAATRPAFRSAFVRRRCLVPASGYYEWRAPEPSGGGPRSKVPFYFRRRDGLLLGLGGLWEVWRGPDGEVLRSCTLLTTDANATNAPVHDRMPVIVPERLWARWLAPEPLSDAGREEAVAPAPDDLLVTTRVGTEVNDPRHQGAALIEPVPG